MRTAIRFDQISNALVIVTCVVLIGAVGQRWYGGQDRGSLSGYKINDQVRGVKSDVYRGADKTLLLFVRSTCRFCTASMDLYRRAIQAAGKDTHVVAVGPESQEALRDYFERNHVPIPATVNSDFTQALVSATPTVLLVNRKGRILNIWIGQLPRTEEERLIASVK